MKYLYFTLIFTVYLILYSTSLFAIDVQVAVVDSFLPALQELQNKFEKTSEHKLIITADTGDKLYAKIKAGQKFEVFLAANNQYPSLLTQQGQVVADSSIIYAVGKLVLWSRQPYLVDSQGRILMTNKFKKLALSNPKSSPYGAAAQQTLEKLGLWSKLRTKLITSNIASETVELIQNGKAELGFISLSQLAKMPNQKSQWSIWVVPPHLYTPIEHTAVLLKPAENNAAAQEFMAFLQRAIARTIIEDFGYEFY